MARSKKRRIAYDWRYGGVDDPLMVVDEVQKDEVKVLRETDMYLIRLSEDLVSFSIKGEEHAFAANRLYAHKTQRAEEGWLCPEAAYQGAVEMAENLIFALRKGRYQPPRAVLIEGERVKFIELRREYLIFRWKRHRYAATIKDGMPGVIHLDRGTEAPPQAVRCFLVELLKRTWWHIRPPAPPAERTAAKLAKASRVAAPLPLLETLEAPVALRPPKPKVKRRTPQAAPDRTRPTVQPSLFA